MIASDFENVGIVRCAGTGNRSARCIEHRPGSARIVRTQLVADPDLAGGIRPELGKDGKHLHPGHPVEPLTLDLPHGRWELFQVPLGDEPEVRVRRPEPLQIMESEGVPA